MLISIVITTLNEIETIDQFVLRVRCVFATRPEQYELIFVDDNSSDGSKELLAKYACDDARITYISMTRKFGRHACYFAGFKYAKGQLAIMMDSDLQDPPELIPELIDKYYQTRCPIIHSLMTQREGESIIKLWLTNLSYFLLNKLCDIDLPMRAGQFKLISREVIDVINQLPEDQTYFKGLISWTGFSHAFVNLQRQARTCGKTKFSIFGHRPYKDFLTALINFSTFPLYIPLFLFLILSVALTLIVLLTDVDWTKIVMMVIGMSIQLSLTILALYLIPIHGASRQRPRYIIAEMIREQEEQS